MDYFQRKNPDQYQPTCSMPPPASKLDVAKKDASQWMDCVEPFWERVFHGFPILNPIFISKSRWCYYDWCFVGLFQLLDSIHPSMTLPKEQHSKRYLTKNDNTWPEGLLNHCLPMTTSVPTAGKVLGHCVDKVTSFRERMGIRLCIFKIGVTSDPSIRFTGYVDKGYSLMWIIAQSTSIDFVHMLEAALILHFHQHVGCKNKGGTGGDGALNRRDPSPPPYYVYITGGRADQPRWVGWCLHSCFANSRKKGLGLFGCMM